LLDGGLDMSKGSENLDKVAIITGASSGIGRATALCLASAGYDIFLIARREDKLKKTVKKIKSLGVRVGYLAEDVASAACAEKAVDAAVSKRAGLDAMILCAGQGFIKSIAATSEEEYKRMFDVNAMSVIKFCKSGFQKMRTGGSIILISSPAGIFGALGMTSYSLSKGGLISFGKSLALELAPRKIRVNIVIPGAVETAFIDEVYKFLSPQQMDKMKESHPLGFGKPEDIANAIKFLVSDEASWITGTVLTVDGGFTVGI